MGTHGTMQAGSSDEVNRSFSTGSARYMSVTSVVQWRLLTTGDRG